MKPSFAKLTGEKLSAYSPEVPGCVATGSTEREAEANMRDAHELHLRGMDEGGVGLVVGHAA